MNLRLDPRRDAPWLRLAAEVDSTLTEIFAAAVNRFSPRGRVALLAVGGYGRRELAPFSDLDLLLVHSRRTLPDEFVKALWYPLWDRGFKVGHAVRTPRQTLQMIRDDLDTATALVTARVIAGDAEFGGALIDKCQIRLRRAGQRWVGDLHARVLQRHRDFGEVAFLLEPNLKEGLGGLRDIHALWWANAVGFALSDADLRVLDECNQVLLRVRSALHTTTGRPGDVLHLQDQASVAHEAGFAHDDALMAAIADAGTRVMWIADQTWARLDPPVDRSPQPQLLAPGVALINGEIHLADDVDPAADPTLTLRVATAAARQGARIDRDSLDRLGRFARVLPEPWPAGASDDLVALLLEGERAIPVWETLDARDLIVRILPEWRAVRCRPQRNAFHRFTVDRHLWQAAANAAEHASRVARPDLLVLSALFHDLGKGYPGDHTVAGIDLFARIGPRMGLNAHDVQIVSKLIEHHLLLPDIATRRDLSDDATILNVARQVGDLATLELLEALTDADARATGPTAWGEWKQELVRTLVMRVRHVLTTGSAPETPWRLFPDAATLATMARGVRSIDARDVVCTVVAPDQPGLFASVAGVLSMHGLDILSAEAHSDHQGMAASRFHLRATPLSGWAPVLRELNDALDGDLDIDERLRERASTYGERRRESALGPQPPMVRFDDTGSSNATVVEVHAPDRIGLLRAITKVIAEQRLDIRHARITTLGDNVVDTFYLCSPEGGKLSDARQRSLLHDALLAAVA